MADHDKGAFDRITGADALPILGGEVEKCHEVFAVFLHAQRHFGIFGLIGFGEQVRGLFRIIFGLGLPNVVNRVLSLWLRQLGQAIEYVDCLVLPTPLLSGRGIDFIHGDPHPYGTVSNRQLGGIQSPDCEAEQNFSPALGRPAHPIFDGQESPLATGCEPNDHMGAEFVVFAA